MKIKINRKSLVGTLKALKVISAKNTRDELKELVVLSVVPQGLVLMAGTGAAFLSVLVEGEVIETGLCNVSYRLYDLLKAARDETITLSFKEKLSVSGDSGFKATLTQNTAATFPIEQILTYIEGGTQNEVMVLTDDLSNLADISKAMPSMTKYHYVEIVGDGLGMMTGTVQGSEYGTLDQFPMDGSGARASYCLAADLVQNVLPFCTTYTTIGALVLAPGYVLLTDADNPTWNAIMGVITNQQGTA